MNNTNNALETLVQRDKQIKKTNDKLKASINELDAELETTTNALSTHASNTNIHTSKEELIQLIIDHLESLDLGITKEVVSVLPTENISDNTLYFVPNDKGSRDEYFYINDKWELVGSTETNFTDYYTKQETDTLLEGKANSVHNHVISDITDFPTIPTKTSQLINDSGFLTSSSGVITSVSWSDIKDKPNFSTVATSGSYTDLSNTPTIPTKLSQLENDSGFINALADVVDTKSTQTINGIKTFTQNVNIKNNNLDLTVTPTNNIFSTITFRDKNNITTASLQNSQRTYGVNDICFYVCDADSNSHGFRIRTDNRLEPIENNTYSLGSSSSKWADVYSTNDITNKVITYSVTNHNDTSSMTVSGGSSWDTGSTLFLYGNSHANYPGAFNLTAKNTTNESELIGFPNGTLTWGGKSLALDGNVVHTSGDEIISGNKTFSNRVSFPSGYYLTTDANDNSLRIIRSGSGHGNSYKIIIQGDTGKIFAPNGFMGNLQGNADTATSANSATYATTQATSDNSTKIATTAWVRTYVNSVVGSGSVGASISAYYSNATTKTAEGSVTGNSGVYPADYSDYINIAPTVGTIYTGSQLFSSFTPTASGTIQKVTPSGSPIYQTSAKATATFSGAFSASAKYLCTTANAVKFRAYVSQGSPTAMGSPSVVDQSSTKSIFLRIQ